MDDAAIKAVFRQLYAPLTAEQDRLHRVAEDLAEEYLSEASQNTARLDKPSQFAPHVGRGQSGVVIDWYRIKAGRRGTINKPGTDYEHMPLEKGRAKYAARRFGTAPAWECALILAFEERFSMLRRESRKLVRVCRALEADPNRAALIGILRKQPDRCRNQPAAGEPSRARAYGPMGGLPIGPHKWGMDVNQKETQE